MMVEVDIVNVDGAWHWLGVCADTKAPLLWNAEPFHTYGEAKADALTTHTGWRMSGTTLPYGKAL